MDYRRALVSSRRVVTTFSVNCFSRELTTLIFPGPRIILQDTRRRAPTFLRVRITKRGGGVDRIVKAFISLDGA